MFILPPTPSSPLCVKKKKKFPEKLKLAKICNVFRAKKNKIKLD